MTRHKGSVPTWTQGSLFDEEELNLPSKPASLVGDKALRKEPSIATLPTPSSAPTAPSLAPLFERLAQSAFRSRFRLSPKDRAYIATHGLDTIARHAADFVQKRLAPAYIPNDGRQTPMRGHPVFLAQHATACCCRGCFAKWHHIPAGRPLTDQEQQYAVSVLMEWIGRQLRK